MKKLVSGAAVGALLVFSLIGQAQAQAPVQPGTPPAAQTQAQPATPYVVPTTTPKRVTGPVRRKSHARARSRSSSGDIANQLNAQQLAHGGVAGGTAAQPGYGAPGHPGLVAASGYPPQGYRPPPAYYPAYYPPPGAGLVSAAAAIVLASMVAPVAVLIKSQRLARRTRRPREGG